MKILHLSPDLKWSKIFILPIAKKQQDRANMIYISAPRLDDISDFHSESIEFINLIGKLKDPISHFVGLIRLVNEVKSNSINEVYCHTSIDSFLPILCLRFFTQSRVIYVNHGVPYEGYKGLLRLAFKIIELSNITFSHTIISITQSMTTLLERINLFKKDIYTLSPGTLIGINFKYQSYQELLEKRKQIVAPEAMNILKLIYVARVERRKGIYEVIAAVNEYQDSNIHLSILGSGSSVLKNINFNKNKIAIKGYIDNLTEHYLNADILIVPSYHEGFGQVYLEAASLGVIPVCADILGPTDFIKHGYNGFTVKPKSVESISNLLKDINNGLYDLEKIRFNAFHSAKEFESSKVVNKNIEVINK